MIQAGETLPETTLRYMSDNGPVATTCGELSRGKKIVIFGVPGAYTPTCNLQHLPGYVQHADDILSKGVDTIACISVNDVFVMDAWGKDTGTAEKVLMLSDGNGEFARACGLEMDGSVFGMGTRLQRFALIAEDGVVRLLHVEKPGAFEVSSAEAVLAAL